MTKSQQDIINAISAEISSALWSYEYTRNEQGANVDEIEATMNSYDKRVDLLRSIRTTLENEFTTLHYGPR